MVRLAQDLLKKGLMGKGGPMQGLGKGLRCRRIQHAGGCRA